MNTQITNQGIEGGRYLSSVNYTDIGAPFDRVMPNFPRGSERPQGAGTYQHPDYMVMSKPEVATTNNFRRG